MKKIEMLENLKVGQNIKKYRQAAGISRFKLARLAGTNSINIFFIERNRSCFEDI